MSPSAENNFLAIDLGASSGRAVLGRFSEGRLEALEVHRFPNLPVEVRGTLYWDVLGLMREIGEGIRRGIAQAGKLDGIGVDTWGVDFGLLDEKGRLLANPVHYRDHRNDGVMERTFRIVSRERMFHTTGLQFLPFNTVFQLMAMKLGGWTEIRRAQRLLMMPDLINYFLCGSDAAEFTIASTTQMFDPRSRNWARDMLSDLDLPNEILPKIVPPALMIGEINCRIPGLGDGCGVPVIAPAEHDTGSAVAAVPAEITSRPGSWAYISSGTWSLMGIETESPIITGEALASNFTNEGGVGGFRFLKNISGLWTIQECRRIWALDEGRETGYPEIQSLAHKAAPFKSLIDLDHPMFLLPENMPAAIARFCQQTGQPSPASKGEFVRCALESLALKYRLVKGQIEKCSGVPIEAVHVVGGGSRDELLNQFAAGALRVPVLAGPGEATAIGNLAVQAMAMNVIDNLAEARRLIAESFPARVYEPGADKGWSEAFARFEDICKRGESVNGP